MKTKVAKYALIAVLVAGAASTVRAETSKFNALVAQKEALRLDFTDGSKHFFLLVHREGKPEGQGPLAGATANEYGAHDAISSYADVRGFSYQTTGYRRGNMSLIDCGPLHLT